MDLTVCPFTHTPEMKVLQLYRELGMTSVQLYIEWNKIESTPGVYDWSAYDQDVEKLRAAGLKMGPFIICGSWYMTPQFVRDEPGMVMFRCVEHNQDSGIPSLWCPNIRPHIERFMQAFADHYLDTGILQYVILGITGDYGEGLYPIVGNGPGAYHGHPGHWCNDPLALADLRRWLKERSDGKISQLNRGWKTRYRSFEDIKPFTRYQAPSPRAYVDLIHWYRQSMTDYCDFWLKTAHSAFKQTPAYLCTGGLMLPEHGADFSAQVKAASHYGAGVRVTNEYSDYSTNVLQTRLVNSAGRRYGAFSAHEPASAVTPRGVLGRIFNAVSSGSSQLFSYPGAYVDADHINAGGEVFKQYKHFLRDRKPVVPVAVFYPDTDRVLRTEASPERFHLALRKLVDYDLVDENMIQDGLLSSYSYLVVSNTEHMDEPSLKAIYDWVHSGGVLLNINCMVTDVEENGKTWKKLLGFTPQTSCNYGIIEQSLLRADILPNYARLGSLLTTASYGPLQSSCRPLLGVQGGWYPPISETSRTAWIKKQNKGAAISYFGLIDPKSGHAGWAASDQAALVFLADILQHAGALRLPAPTPTTLRPQMDGVFLTQFEDGGKLAMNFMDEPLELNQGGRTIAMAPGSICEV
jgi:hypothetical protein